MSHLKLDGGALTKSFIDEVKINSDSLHLFNKFTGEKFNNWRQRMGELFDVADFLIDHGEIILTFWMTKVFSFDPNRLQIKVPRKLSPVDSKINANYTFSKDEMKIIKQILSEYELLDYEQSKAAATIFSNSLKTISKFLSKVINIDYKIFTNKLDHKEKKGTLIIEYEGAGRIQD